VKKLRKPIVTYPHVYILSSCAASPLSSGNPKEVVQDEDEALSLALRSV
jgi:hypothetical protein